MTELPAVVVLGEILWDVIGDTRRLGGAPLNFAAHIRRLGHPVSLISGLGADEPGREAARQLTEIGLDTRLLQTSRRWPTGTAEVRLGPDGSAAFTIARPAAYDAIELSAEALETIKVEALGGQSPAWIYFGTLHAATDQGRRILDRLLGALDGAMKFYDLNLRPGADSPELVEALLGHADVVKLNVDELARVHEFTGLPSDPEGFCRAASDRFELTAVSVTLGARGCAMLANGEFVEAPGHPIVVADTVGAGDSFSAAFAHGLCREWSASQIADFANRVAARVASRPGSLPVSGEGWIGA